MSQGFVPLSCPPLQDCHFGKTGNDSAFQLPAQTTLQLLILISWPNRRYSRCWRLREGLTVVLWDVNLNPLPHKNCPIIQQADCVLSLLIPPQFSSSHLQYIVRPLKIAVFFPPIFPFPPSSLHLTARPVGAEVLLMQSHEFAASTHPLPLQTSILEALNNTSAALQADQNLLSWSKSPTL